MLNVTHGSLRTPRLSLRRVQVEDADALWEALRDPLVYAWIAREPPASPAAMRTRLERITQELMPGRSDQWLNWTIWFDCEAIGIVEATVHPDHSVALGYMLSPKHWRRGFAREAVSAVLRELFAKGAKRIDATIDTGNTASEALVHALGFTIVEARPLEREHVWRLNLDSGAHPASPR